MNLTKEHRMDLMKYIDAMEEVKHFDLLPVLNVATRQMLADYFEVPISTLQYYCIKHSDELADFGAIYLYKSNFINAGYRPVFENKNYHYRYEDYDVCLTNSQPGIPGYSVNAAFSLALDLKKSKVAQKIRDLVFERADADNHNIASKQKKEENEIKVDKKLDEQTETNDVQTFVNPEFGEIRTVIINALPWFVGKDVANSLGYTNSRKAIIDHVDEDDKTDCVTIRDAIGRDRKTTIINESGLYSLVLSSKLPSAKKFKRWITTEVLPSIRKHGAYFTPSTLEKAVLDPDFLIQLANEIKAERQKNQELTAALCEAQRREKELKTTNDALVHNEHVWGFRSVVNALIRSYAGKCYEGNYAKAFEYFYRQLRYKHHIDVKIRQGKRKGGITGLDCINEEEQDIVVALAVAICEDVGINTGKVIGQVNMQLVTR